ncbi:MAG TPA: valine--tRNA ligase [Rubricoccaceae bacterium]|nr:valine--tRNA ligase [Rubricoccaceae bacterium]
MAEPTDAPASPAAPATSTAYDPTAVEPRWYAFWEEGGFFRADPASGKPPFVIPMPPPNVTGRLHMGHALQDAVQDALIRMRRMQGYEVLWIPGIDHAGIATQNVVERELKGEGTSRHALGRAAFVDRVWDWKAEYGDIILQQKRKLGDSADWSRSRFTMDEGFTRAVQTVFVRLYEEGLIYRGDYLVNWDPENRTALSDEEVDNVERDGFLWHVRYPVVDEAGNETGEHVTIATTRPETIPADTAVAVHPDDERYRALVGRRVRVPTTDRLVPLLADAHVSPEFGAGALKVTPGHDKNDFEIGQRHGLPVLNIMNPDGTLNEAAGAYAGLDRDAARERIVADLEAQGLLVKTEPYRGTVPVSSRSKAVIEPLISRQWFVRMKPLAEPALEAVRSGTVTFHPQRWANEYFRWLENVRDWTISRQLWWGHRIPVWYHTTPDGEIDEGRDFVVSVDQPAPGMVQDEDVLDTWFSSWLWPFATLGWPDETEDLKKFYPSTVLVSGYDILFFWIARMIMAGLHFTGQAPYRDVFITGMVKDKLGRWMSKSLGNGIDPLDMIEQYGADAVRFSLVLLCAQGQDIKLDPSKFEMGRNFANKLWNAFNVFGRFMEEGRDYRRTRAFEALSLVERWMLTRLNETVEAVDNACARYRLNEALGLLYDLFWRDYCDWYLELVKPAPGEAMDEEALALAAEVYEGMLRLLHPFMPFITEAMWHRLRPRGERDALVVASWPAANAAETDVEAAQLFELIQAVVTGIRSVRSQYNVPPGRRIGAAVSLADAELVPALTAQRRIVERMAGVEALELGTGLAKPAAAAAVVVQGHEVFVPLAGMIDLDAERARLAREIAQKEGFLKGVEAKLANEGFISRAPEDVVTRERQKAADARAELEKLRVNLSDLG